MKFFLFSCLLGKQVNKKKYNCNPLFKQCLVFFSSRITPIQRTFNTIYFNNHVQAVLGLPMSGQQEVLNKFLCGSVNGEGHHKSPMELITGIKSPKGQAFGKKHRTMVPCQSGMKTLLIRTTTGDPSPQV